MAFTPPNGPTRLADGREVVGTFTAGYTVGVTSAYFPTLAKKHNLTRFVSRSAKGVPAYYWLVEELEALKVKRSNIVADIETGEFVEAPFEGQGD